MPYELIILRQNLILGNWIGILVYVLTDMKQII